MGGKLISNFDSLLNGRIISMAFEFGRGQKLGIISLYAVANGGCYEDSDLLKRDELRKTCVYSIKMILKQWKIKFPTMHVMVLGDMQETWSESDSDNVGPFRASFTKETGIVAALKNTHTSIVRDMHPDIPYLTRFGLKGARGIDHILFPKNPDAQMSIVHASIDEDNISSFYFPSDHKLLQCTYVRCGLNNEEQGVEKIRYAYNQVSSIKLQRSGEKGTDLNLDESQFKGSAIYKAQSTLYAEIQKLTGDTADATNFFLDDIEQTIKILYKSLWKLGMKQGANGALNKLVCITESQAAELSRILHKFNLGVQDNMNFLGLVSTSDVYGNGALVRNSIRLKKGDFKLFSNLPISTKLRYLRSNIQRKKRRITKYINNIREYEFNECFNLKKGKNITTFYDLLQNWNATMDTRVITQRGNSIFDKYTMEQDERERHVLAIKSKQDEHRGSSNVQHGNCSGQAESVNTFHSVSNATTKLINHWLGESNCKQGFHIHTNPPKFKLLKSDLVQWKLVCEEITNLVNKRTIISGRTMIFVKKLLEDTRQSLHRIECKVGNLQKSYKSETITYLLNVCRIEAFAKKILPKGRDIPTTHTVIWDEELNSNRPCKSDTEELIATGNFHGHWMANSNAKINCAFASIRTEGLLGARGVVLNPEKIVNESNIHEYIHNGDKLSKKLKKAFIRAHGKHIAHLFRPPTKEHSSLFYPFYLESSDGNMRNEETLEEAYWKSLSSIPGKARHDGFHLSVLGRFGSRWRQCMLDIIKLILIMRFVPNTLKLVARFPIPKPGRVNEYRPISLCNDVYCFVNSISTYYTSKGILEAEILHKGIGAYIKGRGCANLVSIEQGVREDCIESGVPSSQTDEDEEKFFDRIPVEVLLAAMRVNGFPEQGFLELKASGMEPKAVEIITGKGIAHAQFACGIEQGNPDSPTIANLVIKFKHDIWMNIRSKVKKQQALSNMGLNIPYNPKDIYCTDAYKMHISDPLDGRVTVDRIGYCDDNSRYTSSFDEEDVINTTKFYIQQAGDLSLVTKIGRKGSKSEIHYFNISAHTALKLKKVESIAWSFQTDGPTIEYVPIKICLQDSELLKAYNLSNFHNLSDDDQQNFLDIYKTKAHKHLGLRSTLKGDTSSASCEVLNKCKARMATIGLYKLDRIAQRQSANMLCTTVHSFAPMQMRHSVKELEECDTTLVNYVTRKHGITQTDAKHPLFIDINKGGFGFKSFLDVDTISNAREIEISLNGTMLDSEVIRGRLRAFTMRHDRPDRIFFFNFIGAAINKLAKYGLHVRDGNEELINHMLSLLNQQCRYRSIGDPKYNGSKNYSIGDGKENNLDIAFGSSLHAFLQRAISPQGDLKSNIVDMEYEKIPISPISIRVLLKKAKLQLAMDLTSMYNCWEWNASGCKGNESTEFFNMKRWKFRNVLKEVETQIPHFWLIDEKQLHIEILEILNDNIPLSILKRIHNLDHTMFVATDGSHVPGNSESTTNSHHITTGAAVLCIGDIRENESYHNIEWTNRQAIPIFARSCALPPMIGASQSDISHGEGIGACLGMEMVEDHAHRVLIMDSTSVRRTIMSLRDNLQESKLDRNYIRKTISGIGKNICNRAELNLKILLYRHNNSVMGNSLAEKHILSFLHISKQWIESTVDTKNDKITKKEWCKEYWDDHPIIPILKIDSHQLNSEGDTIRQPRRYQNLVPNLFLLSCNHFADKAAEMTHKLHSSDNKQFTADVMLPRSRLRFFFTWNGRKMDKHVSTCIHNAIQMDRIKEIRKRATQGLPWRIVPDPFWGKIHSLKGLFNSLRGFSRTHTRSLYKSKIYRTGWKMETSSSNVNDKEEMMLNMSEKSWIQYLSKCPWCSNEEHAKGNRYHALLFCKHDRLQSFRNHLSELLEQKLFKFFNIIIQTQDELHAHAFLQGIENVLLKLHDIKKENEEQCHLVYRTRTSWKREERYSSWKELLNSSIPIFGHIFGFIPVAENTSLTDQNLNHATCIPLGIIPNLMDKEINKVGDNLKKFDIDTSRRKTIIAGYWKRWNEIKEINIMRVIGLHRIIGDISKEYETTFRKKYELYDNTWRSLKRPLRINATNDNTISVKKPKLTIQSQDTYVRTKFCTGITCSRIHKGWSFALTPNRIDSTKKQCQRCMKQQHAFKKGVGILTTCLECLPPDKTNTLVGQMDNTVNNMNYKGTIKCLGSVNTIDNMFQTSPTKKRKGISDTQKGIIKTINTSIAKMTNIQDEPTDRIKNAIHILQNTIDKSNTFLKDDLNHNIAINNEMVTNKSYNQQQIRDNETNNTSHNNQICLMEEDRIKADISSALVRNQWMYSFSLDRAIRNIRIQGPNNVYIANTGISTDLRTWTPVQGWQIIARHFRSVTVLIGKPHGVYLIPIFSGNTNSGHWNIAVIWKRSTSCKGWMLDSLGQGNTNSIEAKNIKNIFSRARLRCCWQEIECRKQIEVECGPRSIVSMVSICDNIKNGDEVEIAIQKATLMHVSESNYTSSIIRRKAASLMRMTEQLKARWEENERQLRQYFRRNRDTRNTISQLENDIIEIN